MAGGACYVLYTPDSDDYSHDASLFRQKFVNVFARMASEYYRFAGEFKIDADKAFIDSDRATFAPKTERT